jgi:adenine phosphoribosyltransferase
MRSPSSSSRTAVDLEALIREVPDFPRPGISFKDATPLMARGEAFAELIGRLAAAVTAEAAGGPPITHVVAPEARGFIFGAALATAIGAGFVPTRKPGRLPRATRSAEYELEYGADQLHAHRDAFAPGDVVVVCDDLIATGGTAGAVAEIVLDSGAELAAFAFAIELDALGGREALARFGAPILSVIRLEA